MVFAFSPENKKSRSERWAISQHITTIAQSYNDAMRDTELLVIKLLEVLHSARGVHAAVDEWTLPLLQLLRRIIEGVPFAEEVKHVTMRALAAAMGIARAIAEEAENYFGVFMVSPTQRCIAV